MSLSPSATSSSQGPTGINSGQGVSPRALRPLLKATGFSKNLLRQLSVTYGFVYFLDDSELIHHVLQDFASYAATKVYTHMPLEMMTTMDPEEYNRALQMDSLRQVTRAVYPGSDVHRHGRHGWLTLCVELHSTESSQLRRGQHHYLCALVAEPGRQADLESYLQSQLQVKRNLRYISVYLPTHDHSWLRTYRRARQPDTLLLPRPPQGQPGLWEDVLNEARDFFSESTREEYARHGWPWTRKVMLCGPPGTGKTTLVHTLATVLDKPVYVLNLGQSGMGDVDLISLTQSIPSHSLVIMEDLDHIFQGWRDRADNVNRATVLGFLDGFLSREGIVSFITCNTTESFDEVLLREGRVDRIYEFDHVTRELAGRALSRYYPDSTDQHRAQFARIVKEKRLPPAALQEFFKTQRKRTLAEALEAAQEALTTGRKKRRRENRLVQ